MHFIKAWLLTTTIFFVGDIVWLYFVMNRFFVPQIKHLMSSSGHGININYFSALLAYVCVSTALTIFVVLPLRQESLIKTFLYGAFLGLCLYGVYEFTNYATLRHWPLSFLIADLSWGALWCGVVSVISILIIR